MSLPASVPVLPAPGALVIIPGVSSLAGATDTVHGHPAETAVHFPGQEILDLIAGGGFRTGMTHQVEPGLHAVEGGPVDDRGAASLNTDTGLLQDPDVLLRAEDAMDRVMIERLSDTVPKASPVQLIEDLALRHSVGVLLEGPADIWGPALVEHEITILRAVPERNPASDEFALGCALPTAAPDLLRELQGVILGAGLQHGLEDDALRIVTDLLHRGKKLHAVLLQLVFIDGAVVPVPGKAVQFVDNDILPGLLPGVVDHMLKLRPVIGAAGDRPVDVLTDDGEALALRVLVTDVQLPFDALLILPVGTVPRINHSIFHRYLRPGRSWGFCC